MVQIYNKYIVLKEKAAKKQPKEVEKVDSPLHLRFVKHRTALLGRTAIRLHRSMMPRYVQWVVLR